MALISPKMMIYKAHRQGYAIPAFNVHNLETIQAVVKGAARLSSPVIIATTPGTIKHAGADYIAAIVKTAAKKYDIPIALHADHCGDYDLLESCVAHGYTSLMIDGSKLKYEDNVYTTRKVVALGHYKNVCVEAE